MLLKTRRTYRILEKRRKRNVKALECCVRVFVRTVCVARGGMDGSLKEGHFQILN